MGTLRDRKILVTGHTGFKGAWLALWLHKLGAKVHGFALPENPKPGAYTALGVRSLLAGEMLADLRAPATFDAYYNTVKPEFVFHLAAQALVGASYSDPIGTLETNFMGTARVLEAIRTNNPPCAAVIVTSDKCYTNHGDGRAYSETDAMGGHDIYSASKGACELLAAAYRQSFSVKVATARAGNVVGGGDYADARIAADCVRALSNGRTIGVRNPESTRPWQHVLEPLSGYIRLAEKLSGNEGASFCEGWNFGPRPDQTFTVRAFVEEFIAAWGSGAWEQVTEKTAPSEAQLLNLSIAKAGARLAWHPTWDQHRTIRETVEWYQQFERSPKTEGCMRDFSLEQIRRFNGA